MSNPPEVKSLTALEYAILDMLLSAPKPGLCGKEMVERSAGALKLGSIYVTLQRMESKRLVESERQDSSDMAHDAVVLKRFYVATQRGRDLVMAAKAHDARGVKSKRESFA